jgi:hypothetical protein
MKLNEYIAERSLFDSRESIFKENLSNVSITENLKNILIQIFIEGHTDRMEVTK